MKLWVSVTDENGVLLDRFPIMLWEDFEKMPERSPEALETEIPSQFGSLERRLLEELKKAKTRQEK